MQIFSGGKGTEQEPYLIETVEDLLNIKTFQEQSPVYPDFYYRQNANIDLSDVAFEGVSPSMPFFGRYDGGRFKIKGLKLQKENDEYKSLGFFNNVANAHIRRVVLEAPILYLGNPNSKDYMDNSTQGFLINSAVNSIIEECSVIAPAVDSYANEIGGLIGTVLGGTTIKKCEVREGTLACLEGLGGLFGSVHQGVKVINCYVEASIHIKDWDDYRYGFVGGIVNPAGAIGGEYENCYANVTYSGRKLEIYRDDNNALYSLENEFVFVNKQVATTTSCYENMDSRLNYSWQENVYYRPNFFIKGTDNKLYNCYNFQPGLVWEPPDFEQAYNYQARPISGNTWEDYWEPVLNNSKYPEARTGEQMQTQANYTGWNFEKVWIMGEGGFPRLRFPPARKFARCKKLELDKPLTKYRKKGVTDDEQYSEKEINS